MRRCLATWPNAVAIVRGINNACAATATRLEKMGNTKAVDGLHIFIGPAKWPQNDFRLLMLMNFSTTL